MRKRQSRKTNVAVVVAAAVVLVGVVVVVVVAVVVVVDFYFFASFRHILQLLEEINKSRCWEDPKCGLSIFIGKNYRNSRPRRNSQDSTHKSSTIEERQREDHRIESPIWVYLLNSYLNLKKTSLMTSVFPIIFGSTSHLRDIHPNFRALGPSHNLDSSTMTTKVRAAALPRLQWLHVHVEIPMGRGWLLLGLRTA